eukprot:366354-Chlamydomonas_euryale.AAC.12
MGRACFLQDCLPTACPSQPATRPPLHCRSLVQACYLPIPAGNAPIIGAVPSVRGAYVATGHSCWGILNAPATGKALAELILDGHVSYLPGGLSAFDPARF